MEIGMNNTTNLKKTRDVITILVIIITAICCVVPLITKNEIAQTSMISAFGEEITFYGRGIYARNSFSGATQAVAQDIVTLILAIPAMIAALWLVKQGNILAQFVLTGLLAYTLYTYMSYAFMMYYNSLFLLYVADMTLSFYGFVISVRLLMHNDLTDRLQEGMKTKGLRIFLCVTGVIIAFMWSGRILPTIGTDKAPVGLDNYSTLVIQVLDLGVIVPACFVISHLLKSKSKLGFVLGPVIIIKAVMLVVAVLAMAVYMSLSGINVEPVEYLAFGSICIFACGFLVRILKQIQKEIMR